MLPLQPPRVTLATDGEDPRPGLGAREDRLGRDRHVGREVAESADRDVGLDQRVVEEGVEVAVLVLTLPVLLDARPIVLTLSSVRFDSFFRSIVITAPIF